MQESIMTRERKVEGTFKGLEKAQHRIGYEAMWNVAKVYGVSESC